MAPRSSPHAGKKVDTWYYEYKGISSTDKNGDDLAHETVEPRKVAIDLFIRKNYAESEAPPLATKKVWFEVRCADPKIDLEGSDIEALRLSVWSVLDTAFAIRWERYYLVRIDPSFIYGYVAFRVAQGFLDQPIGAYNRTAPRRGIFTRRPRAFRFRPCPDHGAFPLPLSTWR